MILEFYVSFLGKKQRAHIINFWVGLQTVLGKIGIIGPSLGGGGLEADLLSGTRKSCSFQS